MTEDFKWDLEADVVVLGSGGAAMTAAIAAHDFGAKDVVILEKTGMVGGTTAMSGGMLWIPGNHHQIEAASRSLTKTWWPISTRWLRALLIPILWARSWKKGRS
jgi:succinate dehydrogenase/fumarate reductase flavoprotein subunit